MTLTSEPETIKDQARIDLALQIGEFILNHLPYSADVRFPVLPPLPEFPAEPQVLAQNQEEWQRQMQDFKTAKMDALKTTMPEKNSKIPPRYKDQHVVQLDGLYPELTSAHPLKPEYLVTNGDLMEFDTKGELLYWEMNDAYHQVTKAMRIWYTYTATEPTMGGDTEVGTFIIVGYVGNGQP